MGVKLKMLGEVDGTDKLLALFFCPGCNEVHPYRIARGKGEGPERPVWKFNGSLERPTFTPSLLCNQGRPDVCHLYLTDGQIIFCGDSHHALAGKTVECPDWDDKKW